MYRARLQEWNEQNKEVETVDEEWKKLKEAIHEAIVKKEIKIKERKGKLDISFGGTKRTQKLKGK